MQIHPMDKADSDCEAIEAHANHRLRLHTYMHYYSMDKADPDSEATE
jgi:hypothetical protein